MFFLRSDGQGSRPPLVEPVSYTQIPTRGFVMSESPRRQTQAGKSVTVFSTTIQN